MTDTLKEHLTIKEFALCIGVHPGTVRKMIRLGRINSFRTGTGGDKAQHRIARSEIQRLCLVDLEPIVNRLVEERLKERENERL